ncbi:MAG TPA: hypothetical protein VGK74_22940 [Symbiobacteriaceae bacterium]
MRRILGSLMVFALLVGACVMVTMGTASAQANGGATIESLSFHR